MRKGDRGKALEAESIADWLHGFAAAVGVGGDCDCSMKLEQAACKIDKLSRNMCGHGFVGCRGGDNCGSDHK